MVQFLGVLIGALAGVVWEILATTPYQHFLTVFPSLFVKHARETLHIHHWIIYFLVLIMVFLGASKTNRLTHPAVLFIISFLIAALVYNFWRFPDWYRFDK